MGKRADDVAETRRRIVETAVHMHGTIGPAATTISALAEQAGVTRLTVYRHFPDNEQLFAACSQHWFGLQVLPDPAAWREIADPDERLRAGLTDLYRYYRDGEGMLTNIARELDQLPAAIQEQLARAETGYRDTLLAPFRARGSRRLVLRAVIAHAVAFGTWRSLCVDNGLDNEQAVQVMTAVALAASPSRARPLR